MVAIRDRLSRNGGDQRSIEQRWWRSEIISAAMETFKRRAIWGSSADVLMMC